MCFVLCEYLWYNHQTMTDTAMIEQPHSRPSAGQLVLSGNRLYDKQTGALLEDHATPSHYELEQAIKNERYRTAQRLGARALERGSESGTITDQTRLVMQYLALPIYQRRSFEKTDGSVSPILTAELEAIHGRTAEHLQTLLDRVDSYHTNEEHAILEGNLSDFTIFLLAMRTITGAPDDRYDVWPSTLEQDWGIVDEQKLHHGFDQVFTRRTDNTEIHVQVKTSQSPLSYADDILVLVLNELIKSTGHTARDLQRALLFELTNDETGAKARSNSELIETASRHLFTLLDEFQSQSNRLNAA